MTRSQPMLLPMRLALLLFAARCATAIAQDDGERTPFLIGAAGHYGFIIPHSQELVDVSTSHPFALELDAAWLLADARRTRASGLVAQRGVALQLVDFQAPELLGHMISITPYIEPMIRAQDKVYGAVRLGVGLGYLDRPYNPETNPTNLFYSTHVSFTAMVCAHLGMHLSPQWDLRAGFNFNHLSNGGMRQPNKGMNFPTWSLGASYSLRPVRIQRPDRDDAWRTHDRRYAYALLSASVKNAPEDENGEVVACPLAGALLAVGYRTGRLTGLVAGTEWVYDGHAAELAERAGADTNGWLGALVAGPELLSGRVRFGVLLGAYLHAPSWDGDAVYQRYQLACTVGKGLLVGTSLKAHRHVADVFDLRLGWAW